MNSIPSRYFIFLSIFWIAVSVGCGIVAMFMSEHHASAVYVFFGLIIGFFGAVTHCIALGNRRLRALTSFVRIASVGGISSLPIILRFTAIIFSRPDPPFFEVIRFIGLFSVPAFTIAVLAEWLIFRKIMNLMKLGEN